MISQITTCLLNNEDTETDIYMPCMYNDIFYCQSEIYFGIGQSYIADKTSNPSINTDIENYTIIAFLSQETVEDVTSLSQLSNVIKSDSYSLSTSDIKNNFITKDISNTLDYVSHEYLIENSSAEEIFNLGKKFVVVFRIVLDEDVSSEIEDYTIKENDIIQNINILFDTSQQGPYDVEFECIDIVDPNLLSEEDRLEIYQNRPVLIGTEGLRSFYPKNLPEGQTSPFFGIFHGNQLMVEGYDSILQKIASYGYFASSFTAYADASAMIKTYYFLSVIDVLKNYLNIHNIDFSRLNVSGHSRGNIMSICIPLVLKYKGSAYDILSQNNIGDNINFEDIKSVCLIAPSPESTPYSDGSFIIGSQGSSNFISGLTSNYSYFEEEFNKPILNILAEHDTNISFNGPFGSNFNINSSGKNINYKKDIVFKNKNHNDLYHSNNNMSSAAFIFNTNTVGYDNDRSNGSNMLLNSRFKFLNYVSSKILEFLSTFNFNKKILDLEKIDLRKNPIPQTDDRILNIILSRETHGIEYKYENIDDFLGQASNFNFDHTMPVCLTGPMKDNSLYPFYTSGGSTYKNLIDNNRLFIFPQSGFTQDDVSTDPFNKIAGHGYGMMIGFNDTLSSYYLKYSPNGSPATIDLSLFDGSSGGSLGYIQILGCQAPNSDLFSPNIGTTLNDFYEPTHFCLKLVDNNGESAELSSKTYGVGFEPQTYYSFAGFTSYYPPVPVNHLDRINNIKFPIVGMNQKNKNLDLQNISEIFFLFGSDHGTTTGQIAIEDISIIS